MRPWIVFTILFLVALSFFMNRSVFLTTTHEEQAPSPGKADSKTPPPRAHNSTTNAATGRGAGSTPSSTITETTDMDIRDDGSTTATSINKGADELAKIVGRANISGANDPNTKTQNPFEHPYDIPSIMNGTTEQPTNATTKTRPGTSTGTDTTRSNGRLYRPHIVLVIIDDMGSYDLGMHGTGIRTDTADRLASEGLYLTNYYVHPICTTTRASLYTGIWPRQRKMYRALLLDHTGGMSLDVPTVADVLNRAGYRSHLVGKWHVGGSRYEYLPTFRGFQSFFGFAFNGMQDHFQHTHLGGYDMRYEKEPNCGPTCAVVVNERGNYSSTIFARESIRVIHEHSTDHKEEPLFLVLSYAAVHNPVQMPKKYRSMYKHMKGGLWDDPRRKLYAGMLTAADDSLADVIQALKDNNIWDDTLVVYTSDNGAPMLHPSGSSNFPYKDGKGTVWEGGIAVDGIIGGPAREKVGIQGGTYPHLMHVVDWLPTLAEMAHVSTQDMQQTLDGVSQLSTLRGNADRSSDDHLPPARTEVFLGFDDHVENVAHRKDQYKLVWNTTSNATHLHDLDNDPSERNDLSLLYANITSELTRTVTSLLSEFKKGGALKQGKGCCKFTLLRNSWSNEILTPWCGRQAIRYLKDMDKCTLNTKKQMTSLNISRTL